MRQEVGYRIFSLTSSGEDEKVGTGPDSSVPVAELKGMVQPGGEFGGRDGADPL